MSSGDRGGAQELGRIIKTTRTPIICICNDREAAKVRSLAASCYDLTFNPPSTYVIIIIIFLLFTCREAIVRRLQYICKQEKIEGISRDQLSVLVESSNGDMRQCLNKLQMITTYSQEALSHESDNGPDNESDNGPDNGPDNEQVDKKSIDMASLIPSFAMDLNLSQTGFEAAKQMLVGTAKHSFNERYNMFYNDYELTPLVIQQNYLDSLRSKYQSSEMLTEKMAEAADSICDLEYVHERMIRDNVWNDEMIMMIIKIMTMK